MRSNDDNVNKNNCWFCKHNFITCNKVVTHRNPEPYVFCNYNNNLKVLTTKDVENSISCPYREEKNINA